MDIFIDNKNIVLETNRLILRHWEPTDLHDLYEYASIPGVGELAGWKAHSSIETSKNILNLFIENKEKNTNFAIVYKENNKVIGSISFQKSWANDEPQYANLRIKEIGYVLSKDYWGNGLVPEAAKEMIRFAFDDCNLDVVTCGHFLHNIQSRRVIEKCGFTFFKYGEYKAIQLDKTFEHAYYILFKNQTNDTVS